MTRQTGFLAMVVAVAFALSSCASLDVNTLPAPGKTYSDGYDVVMEFENVLNLPAKAKVTLDGKTVGIVTGVAIAGRLVNVTARIDSAVEIPSNIRAVLQQATVLGDIYVALDRTDTNSPAAPAFRPGARIPLAQTTSPPQLEETIAHLADFVGSGSIQRIQNTIIGLNRVTPPSGELRKLAAQFAADMSDFSNNIDTVDQLLNGIAGTGQALHNEIPKIQYWFSRPGMVGWSRGIQLTGLIGNTLPSLGSIYAGGFWLVPLLNSLADALGAVQKSKWAFEVEYPKYTRLLTEFFLPQDKYPAINITSIVGPDGKEMAGKIQDVLRIIGATP